MYVYAKDKLDGDFVSCIDLEECKASPWRWEYIKEAPSEIVVVQEVKEVVELENIKLPKTRVSNKK